MKMNDRGKKLPKEENKLATATIIFLLLWVTDINIFNRVFTPVSDGFNNFEFSYFADVFGIKRSNNYVDVDVSRSFFTVPAVIVLFRRNADWYQTYLVRLPIGSVAICVPLLCWWGWGWKAVLERLNDVYDQIHILVKVQYIY